MPARPPGTGRRAWWVLAGTLRFVGRVLRGLIAAVVLLALVVGLPWALWHYIGWPLPHHVPTWNEVRALLLAPMTPTFLLDVLAVACWIAWAAFVLDVARCTMDAVRGARWPEMSTAPAGPLQTFAAVLIGSIVLSLLGQRTTAANATASAGWSDAVSGHAPVVATAVWHQPPSERLSDFTITPTAPTAATERVAPSATALTAVVRAPENGVHDSLWRLARDTLGNPDRWPEIFSLNEGAPQPDGHRLTVPSLIYPGEELRLPPGAHPYTPGSLASPAQPAATTSSPPAGSANPPASTSPVTSTPAAPTTTTTPPAIPSTTQPAPSTGGAIPGTAHRAPTATPPTTVPAGPSAPAPGPPSDRHSGLQLGTDIFLGLGLAAAASAALMLARHRYRRGYQPGSGRRDDLPVAPVVYQLKLAHLRATREDYDDDPDDNDETGSQRVGPRGPTTPLVITNRHQA
ncbi:MAG TPA: hypothetical protein VEO01_13705, partial [Pseudonocardiaceae bacterium]|nr:hypothetical protein [Pseudonocardiaceae bacterium]